MKHAQIRLTASLEAWPGERFKETLQQELKELNLDQLPLQQALRRGNTATLERLQIMINHVDADSSELRVGLGIFFSSLITGCSCADDPSPPDLIDEYAEFEARIDLENGNCKLIPLGD